MEVNTPVILEMPMPATVCGGARLRLFCQGQVVRVAQDPHQKNLVQIALAIDSLHAAASDAAIPAVASMPAAQMQSLLHDLNRQLAIVVGNADLLLSGPDADPAMTDRLRDVKRGALAAAAIVQKLPT